METGQLKELYDNYFYYIIAADIGIGRNNVIKIIIVQYL